MEESTRNIYSHRRLQQILVPRGSQLPLGNLLGSCRLNLLIYPANFVQNIGTQHLNKHTVIRTVQQTSFNNSTIKQGTINKSLSLFTRFQGRSWSNKGPKKKKRHIYIYTFSRVIATEMALPGA